MGFGEVSLTANKEGDLCRIAIWGKRAMEEPRCKSSYDKHLWVPLIQVVGGNCDLYGLHKFGDVFVIQHIGTVPIIKDVQGLISYEKDLYKWIGWDRLVTDLLQDMDEASKLKREHPLPVTFPGLSTPSAREMPQLADGDKCTINSVYSPGASICT